MTTRRRTTMKPEALRIIQELHQERGEPGMCMFMTYSVLTHGNEKITPKILADPDLRAVHGMVTAKTGKRIWHSWIEFGNGNYKFVYDPIKDDFYGKADYYTQLKAKPEYALTKAKYQKLFRRTGHTGWYTEAERKGV